MGNSWGKKMEFTEHSRLHQEQYLAELLDFVRIPSISALPEHAGDVRDAAQWVATRLLQADMEHVQVMETGGHPVVYGDWMHAPGQPVILIYGHFDVQPVDPLDLWRHPPFEPVVEEGRVVGRGASDSKGNMLAPIVAIDSLLRSEGRLPVNVKFCFEGQEEIGSPQISDFLAREKERFRCDLAISSDGGQWSADIPSLTVSLRGVCGVQIDVMGPDHDVHSGSYGGSIHNPIHALASILASMHDADGAITVDGFYDDVRPLTADERRETARFPYDEERYMADLGVDSLFGEPGYSTRERTWHRPTLEVNGIWGGFQQEGIKTVLPSTAHAKITCRLVADQEPAEIRRLLMRHVENHTPPGVKVTVTPLSMNGKPYSIPLDHPDNQAAREVLEEIYGAAPYYMRTGGSIPICGEFLAHLGVNTVNFGFGRRDELAHSPNEFFRLSSFRRSQSAYCQLLHRLAV